MRLTPNLNGTSRERLVEQRQKVYAAISALQEAMGNAWPNGRDYQLAPDPPAALRADIEDWEALGKSLHAFRNRMEEEAYEINHGGSR